MSMALRQQQELMVQEQRALTSKVDALLRGLEVMSQSLGNS